jgi:CheY-like chemotaxis protein
MSKACNLLLVEDRQDDAMLIRRAIAHSPNLALVHHAKNAKETVSYLQGAGVYADRQHYPLPDVLVLDLEMPNEDGFQVLDWLKGSSLANSVKAVALAAADHPAYITRASALGARCCLPKPLQDATIQAFARQLEDWCHSALPASQLN